MASDTTRLRYMMENGPDGFVHVKKDRYEYALDAAIENGDEEPTASAELEGFRRLIDCAMAGGDIEA
jgi:hypothetical protein